MTYQTMKEQQSKHRYRKEGTVIKPFIFEVLANVPKEDIVKTIPAEQKKFMTKILEGSLRHRHARRKKILYSMVAVLIANIFVMFFAGPFTSMGSLAYSLFLACEIVLFSMLIREIRGSYKSFAKLRDLLNPDCPPPIRAIERGTRTFISK